MVKFEVYRGQDRLYYWRLKTRNGEIVCWSEGYNTQEGARTSVEWVKSNAAFAIIVYL